MPPPYPVVRARVDRAIARRDLAAVRSPARDLPSVVTFADAVQILLLMLEADDPAFDAAAVRWIARFASECGAVTLSEVHAALEALDALPASDAQLTLTGLLSGTGCAARAACSCSSWAATPMCSAPVRPADGVGAALLCQGRWNGTVVTTILGSGRNARRSRGAIWLCRLRCHQCRTTNSGKMTVSVTSGRWRCSASM